MILKLYNTRTRDFSELANFANVKVYACGPTVYNYAHIGNFRTYIFGDLLIKTLRFLGYKVNYAMNITDIGHLTGDLDDGEDKVAKTAREKGLTVYEISKFFTEAFFKDCKKLNVVYPDKVLIASKHIPNMIEVVKILEEKKITYFSNGNVYFDTSCFKSYGEMAGIDLIDKDMTFSRVDIDKFKRNKTDFVLWFTNSKFKDQEMKWDSPWGFGYPSWHLECAAMNLEYFKDTLDIHLGGVDHIGVHHINEIAIVECFLNKKWCDIFVHGEFLIMDYNKMSKSHGNFITVKDLEEQNFSPLDFRYLCLTSHYRNQLKFSFNNLKASKIARENMINKLSYFYASLDPADLNMLNKDLKNFGFSAEKEYYDSFVEKVSFDLNVSKGLALLWEVIKSENLGFASKLKLAFIFDEIISLNLREEILKKSENHNVIVDENMKTLIEERRIAKCEKNFKRADEIRDFFAKKGFVLIDTKEGTKVKRG
ncbi:cysteine--tRNA ligase [Borreliella garinii]|uniref:cysteine--tRNA ligase n=1 Tax=Borreliella garinii TaxID=29519 RepID=UPI002B4BE94E|nr:cysteine--tRNA ligase [Borreliella garinii]WRM48747.1 cysteine--tRNA ligase [Borreliella garinii]